MNKVKTKKCTICKEPFRPKRSSLEKVCSLSCSIAYAKKDRAKKEAKAKRKEKAFTKQQLEDLKPLSYWIKKCQTVFNTYIRTRDKGKPCISCGQMEHKGNLHQAGHYFSTGAYPELRFHESNNHGQCVKCNMHLSGNLIPYTENLPNRIGVEKFNQLKQLKHKPKNYGKSELQEMIKLYKEKTREIEG